jgi:endonuclease/exonuclease/phosphatase family metal-dependent hydrolase
MILRIMSFNIRNSRASDGLNAWENRRDIVTAYLRETACHAVGLQEVRPDQFDDLRDGLPEYGLLGVGRDDGDNQGERAAILYRRERLDAETSGTFWFSEAPETPGLIDWESGCVRVCTWARLVERETGRAFYFYNLHLDHRSQLAREKSVELLGRRIAERPSADPYAVTGDFNAAEDNPAMLYLLGRQSQLRESWLVEAPAAPPLADAFRALHPEARDAGTCHGFEGRRDGAKIDYILVDPGARILEAEIDRARPNGCWLSDHFPLTARVAFRTGVGMAR